MEIWKDIRGYESLYQVSDQGHIKRLYKTKGERLLVPVIDKDGYCKVTLSKGGTTQNRRIHRLVAEAFIENPNNLPVINHKDERKQNNTADNLEWCSVQYNTCYGSAMDRKKEKLGKTILQFTLSGEFVRSWQSAVEIKNELGFATRNIRSCCLNYQHRKSAYGYVWRYAE